MNNDYMIQYIKELAAKAINEMAGKLVVMPGDMYVVWFCKILQNWKGLASTDALPKDMNGIYVEITHNGNRGETYCDVYKKANNICYKDFEV